MDELLKETRELMEPEWDDVREARVLSRILERAGPEAQHFGRDRTGTFPCLPSKSEPTLTASPKKFARAQPWMAGAAVVVAAAASLLVWFSQPESLSKNRAALVDVPTEASLAPGVSEILFSAGTSARLAPGAHVETLEKSSGSIELRQLAGKVSYEVEPNRGFHFKVHARDVLVEVVGTAFEVNVEASAVEVRVTRGLVTVTEGERRVDLKAGDDLRINTAEPEKAPKEVKPKAPLPADVVTWLMSQADEARREKKWDIAARHLDKVVRSYSSDGRSINALFTLGRVERARGQFKESAAAFRIVQDKAQGSALAEDALAEEAVSLALGGNFDAAKQRARAYQTRFPAGPHAGRLSKLLK